MSSRVNEKRKAARVVREQLARERRRKRDCEREKRAREKGRERRHGAGARAGV